MSVRSSTIPVLFVIALCFVASSGSHQSHSGGICGAAAMAVDDLFADDLDIDTGDDIMPEEDGTDANVNSADVNGSGGSGVAVGSLANLQNLFATGIASSCENERIAPEESCCHAPGEGAAAAAANKPSSPLASSAIGNGGMFDMMGGGADQHECFAPPIHDEEHPWDSSPSLVEAMKSAVTEISPSELEQMIAQSSSTPSTPSSSSSNGNGKVLIIDTRCAAEFVAGHIPSAVFGGMGTDQFDRFIGTVHSDHNVPVVFIHTPPFALTPTLPATVGGGAATSAAAAAAQIVADQEEAIAANKAAIEEIAQRLVKAGLSNLKGHLRGGMAAWLAARKPVTTVERWNATTLVSKLLVDKERIVNKHNKKQQQQQSNTDDNNINGHHPQSLVDLREPCASDFSSLPNAESIPVSETVLQEVAHRAAHETDPNHPLVLFCSNGFRSLMVASALKALRPEANVVCMDAGFDDLEHEESIKAVMAL